MKNTTTLICAFCVIMLLLNAGCTSRNEDTDSPTGGDIQDTVTAEEINANSLSALENVDSYAYDTVMDYAIKSNDEQASGIKEMKMKMTGKGETDLVNERTSMEIESSMLGMTSNTVIYYMDDTQYLYIPSIGWVKNSTEKGLMNRENQLRLQKEMMTGSKIERLADEDVDGTSCYVLYMKPERETAVEILKQQMGDISSLQGDITESIKSIEITAWITKDTFYYMKTRTQMSMEKEAGTIDADVIVNFRNYNQPVNIELPPEALEARDMSELAAEGEPV